VIERGYVYAIASYLLWGLLTLYWKPLHVVPAGQLVAYRVVLSAAMLGLLGLFNSNPSPRRLLANRQTLRVHGLSAVLIGVNWLTFLYAIATDRVVESSLGYFMTPLVSVLLGMVVLRERLTTAQWVALGFAALGVVVLTIEAGVVPWIAMVLAASFGLYGLVRKLSPLESVDGLSAEVYLLCAPALAYLVIGAGSTGLTVPDGWRLPLLLCAGLATTLPLLLFAAAARSIPLSAVGLLQYVNPTMQFVIGAILFDEPVSTGRLAGFAVIWTGLGVFVYDSFRRRGTSVVVVEPATGLAAE
jgi:chloramphenicol-sensitive protein RarD